MKKSKISKTKIRKIIERYSCWYYKQDWDTGLDEEKQHIDGYLFDKLEKELQELVEYEKELARQQEQDAQDMINAGAV